MGRLLLVEDNPDVADATGSMLLQLGYDVTHARSASAALSATKTATFDLVISDIVMAGEMNGLDLARKLRELYPELPVMLVTGYSNLADVAAKEFTLMRKPYQASEIGHAAANLLVQARHGSPDNSSICARFAKPRGAAAGVAWKNQDDASETGAKAAKSNPNSTPMEAAAGQYLPWPRETPRPAQVFAMEFGCVQSPTCAHLRL